MLTQYEILVLENFRDKYIAEVVNAIQTKLIKRAKIVRDKNGNVNFVPFEATVNNTGALAKSVRGIISYDTLVIYAAGYIDTLIYGRSPNPQPPIDKIESWLTSKGLGDYSAWGIARNIAVYGNSIWRVHKGADSGLLADIDLDAILAQAKSELTEYKIESITNELLSSFKFNV
jgi:hypothetical protein